MWSTIADVSLVAATVTVGLVAGVFFGFAVAVMPGLGRTDDATFVTAMRAINEAILNRWFLGCFVGAVPLAVIAVVTRFPGPPAALVWTIVGLVAYLITFGITMGVNVPLNNRLKDSSEADSLARAAFEPRWNRFHAIRTVSVVAATVALCVALILAS
ncbi:DUF1772 domain-containing protein [Stackebrandtia soli]|uniref:anthrone oxygenase family protein n=1 Tax=Stackebrandtia soli TaxID=1892856 RepID=UPI0039EA7856